MGATDPPLMQLVRAIGAGDSDGALRKLRADPELARLSLEHAATRQAPASYYFEAINHYAYAGDTALHLAAAAHDADLVATLLELGADVAARNRRGAQPLHYAADGVPGSSGWDPSGQAAVIETLIANGADPDALDKSGVAPLHRAVRTRCAAAVTSLLRGGADPSLTNRSGSSPLKLAGQATGRGGSGSTAAQEQRDLIVQALESHGAKP